jgi:hypothetical protein
MSTVRVRAYCKTSTVTAGSYTGNITLTAYNGCGYVSQTVAAVNGIATFTNIVFTRSPQTGVRLTASASGINPVNSNTFNVTAPTGSPIVTTFKNENFEGATVWARSPSELPLIIVQAPAQM